VMDSAGILVHQAIDTTSCHVQGIVGLWSKVRPDFYFSISRFA
jgi:hypothetical protein